MAYYVPNVNLEPLSHEYYVCIPRGYIALQKLDKSQSVPQQSVISYNASKSSYYGGKLIYKTRDGGIHVVTIPVKDEKVVLSPSRKDFQNLDIILSNIEKLRCDMYDSALIPVALVNKLVSLADHPSSKILEKFAKDGVGYS